MNQPTGSTTDFEVNKPYQGQTATYREHDCWHYTETVYHIGSEGTAKECGTCKKILEFRYRSFWKRLWRVFIDF